MGRKLEFDYNRAVDRATRVFWAKGYALASMHDLLAAMGIGEGSFYHLFGSKKRLYQECLRHYDEIVTQRRLDALNAGNSVREGVRAFFRTILDELDNPRTPRVCLLTRSLASEVIEEPSLGAQVKKRMIEFEKSFIKRLEQGKKSGELPRDFRPEVVARVIVTYLQGFFQVAQMQKNRSEAWRQIETLLAGLGL
jgi:TetR/AcrR family transcriptional regulator, transcriptional repressor for nem operon